MPYSIHGEKLYHERARTALPILVRQARLGKTIYYSDLAAELDMPNHRNLGNICGCIGYTIDELNDEDKNSQSIPYIQSLVVNKRTGVPGDGYGVFVVRKDLDDRQRREYIKANHMKDVFEYQLWDEVLRKLGLEPYSFADPPKHPLSIEIGDRGEGDEHRKLKEYVAGHPEIVGLSEQCVVEKEYTLPSGDSVDVAFLWRTKIVVVEVKSRISSTKDIRRGLFQCVKYQAVAEAMLGVEGKPRNVRSVLVLESELPLELVPVRNMLGIEVKTDVTPDVTPPP